MYDSYQQQIQYAGLQPEINIGKEIVIVPFHVVKYRLREGGGAAVEPGMTIYCHNDIYLIDGTPVVKASRITKYLLGRKRLIKGLQLGLKGVRKLQKLRLIISADYAYQDQREIKLIPPNSKLIFEIEVIDIVRLSPQKMTDSQLYYEVYHNLDVCEKHLRKKDEENGLACLRTAYFYAKKIRHYHCMIQGKILLKWGNVLYHRQQYEETLSIISQIEKYNQDIFQDILRLQIKTLRALGQIQQLQHLIEFTYGENMQNKTIKRICVEYYKQTQNKEKLNNLPGYNPKKDQFFKVNRHEDKSIFLSLMI